MDLQSAVPVLNSVQDGANGSYSHAMAHVHEMPSRTLHSLEPSIGEDALTGELDAGAQLSQRDR